MYYLIPVNDQKEPDADFTELMEAAPYDDTHWIYKVYADVEVRPSWVEATEEDWIAHQLGVSSDPLSVAKAQKMQELQSSSDAAVTTFKSSALGSPLTYLSDEKSMAYLNAQYVFVNGVHYDNSISKWYTVENGFVDHTKDQITQVFLDGRAYINEQKTVKLASLLEQVQVAETVEEVQTIVW